MFSVLSVYSVVVLTTVYMYVFRSAVPVAGARSKSTKLEVSSQVESHDDSRLTKTSINCMALWSFERTPHPHTGTSRSFFRNFRGSSALAIALARVQRWTHEACVNGMWAGPAWSPLHLRISADHSHLEKEVYVPCRSASRVM